MRVFLDEVKCDVSAATVGTAIAKAATVAESRGRLVVEVAIDGEAWDQDRLDALTETDETAEEIRLQTADPIELARRALADANATLLDTDASQRSAAELIESDDFKGAMERLATALQGWQDVQTAICLIVELTDMPIDEIKAMGKPCPEIIRSLDERLRLVRSALISQDPIGLSDTLLYELPEDVAAWRELIGEMHDRLGGEKEMP